jgi:hypothetical protein
MINITQIIDNFNLLNNNEHIKLQTEVFTLAPQNNDALILNFELLKTKHKFSLRVTIASNNNICISGCDIVGCHILRLLNINSPKYTIINGEMSIVNDESYLCDVIMLINSIFTVDVKYYDMCSFCGKNIFGSKIISCCDNKLCKQQYHHNVTNNCVTELYKIDPILLKFFMMSLISGCEHPKFTSSFKPLPYIIGVNSAEEFKKIIPQKLKKNDFDYIFENLKNSDDDMTFKNKIGELEYTIIKNAISNNNFIFNSHGNNIIKISYSADIEAKFASKQHFLYHGSNMYSWYPIIKNGLQNMSGTALQLNGAAHGSGMYFSDSFHFAGGYARQNVVGGHRVVGVFEIIDDIEKYKKSSSIFVIPNVEIVLLRYLVVSNANGVFDADTINNITLCLSNNMKIIKSDNSMTSEFSIKRLSKELKKLKKNKLIKSVLVNDDINQIISWNINFNDDMIIKINFVDYPLIPPDMFVVDFGSCERSSFPTNLQNKIILPVLEPTNWTIAITINDIIKTIKI